MRRFGVNQGGTADFPPLADAGGGFCVYTVTIGGQTHELAAGEFCMDIWGFYLEKF